LSHVVWGLTSRSLYRSQHLGTPCSHERPIGQDTVYDHLPVLRSLNPLWHPVYNGKVRVMDSFLLTDFQEVFAKLFTFAQSKLVMLKEEEIPNFYLTNFFDDPAVNRYNVSDELP